MEHSKKTPAYYIKSAIISVLLAGESYLLTKLILQFIEKQNYFTPDFRFMSLTIMLMTLLLLTTALSAGAWDRWEQYVLTPLPIAAGIFIVILPINSAYAVIVSFIVIWLIIYDNFLASQLRDLMISFNPRIILKYSTKGLVLAFSVVATILVMVTTVKQTPLNFGAKAAELAEKYITPKIDEQRSAKVQDGLSVEQLEKMTALGLNPSEFENSETYMLFESFPALGKLSKNMSLASVVENEVNKIVEPYKKFLNPLMAVLMLGLMQFLGFFALLFYTITIDLVFFIAKKSGLLKSTKVSVEKEILHF